MKVVKLNIIHSLVSSLLLIILYGRLVKLFIKKYDDQFYRVNIEYWGYGGSNSCIRHLCTTGEEQFIYGHNETV